MGKPYVGADFTYWFAKETTYGTAVVANMTNIPTEGFVINRDLKSHLIPRATGYRMQAEDASWQDTNGSIPDATMSFYASPQSLTLLPAVLQYNSTYTTSGTASLSAFVDYSKLPDFSANEGYFYTIQAQGPAQAYNERLISAVGKSVKLSISPESNEGCLYVEMGFVAKESSINAANRTGTDVGTSISANYKFNDLDFFSLSTTSLLSSLYEFEINIMNNAKPIPFGGGSNMLLPKVEGNGSFKVVGSDTNILTFKNLAASNPSNNALTLSMYWGSANAANAGDLSMTANIYITGYSTDRTIEGEETHTFEYVLVQDGSVPFRILWKN